MCLHRIAFYVKDVSGVYTILQSYFHSPQSSSQLQHILITMATHSSDYGDEIIRYLLGHSSGQTSAQQVHGVARETSTISALSLDLLLKLCLPTSDINRQR